MSDPNQAASLIRRFFPDLQNQDLIDRIVVDSAWMEFSEDTILMEVGDVIRVVPLVLNGTVKVSREDDSGNSVFLYFVQSGESCAFTLNATLRREHSQIRAVAVAGTKLLAVPADLTYSLNRQFPLWQEFLIRTYSARFRELLEVVDSVCFEQMDVRLLRYLRMQSERTGSLILPLSHQQIAEDLNTRREVVSRLLKKLEQHQAVELHRGRIRIRKLPK